MIGMPIKLAIAGAAGRMGRRLVALASADAELNVVAALEGPGCADLGRDAGELAGVGAIGVRVAAEGLRNASAAPVGAAFDVLIDFSTAAATAGWIDWCVEIKRPIVIGTTGHDAAAQTRIRAAAQSIAVLKSANMSVGVNVLLRLAREVGALLDDSYDVEVVESHHRFKVDAPSGTALALIEAIQRGRTDAGRAVGEVNASRAANQTEPGRPRDGSAPSNPAGPAARSDRAPGEIGVHSLRIGDTVGEHSVQFGNLGETITLAHSAHSRDTFAVGALRAAKWIAGRAPGLYGMEDVLFSGER
ncbi:4-hydroxy-tetrahydrodipicolinate reductase [Phycisphaerae bacterium RAS2]|nr:4-hydroxy-tetrahydrodipicolinate reductase [Phycisphaerae bacterium RAS2]